MARIMQDNFLVCLLYQESGMLQYTVEQLHLHRSFEATPTASWSTFLAPLRFPPVIGAMLAT